MTWFIYNAESEGGGIFQQFSKPRKTKEIALQQLQR
jgi:hypothetical protein